MGLINESRILRTVLNSGRRGAVATSENKTPFFVEVQIFFHSIAMVMKAIQAKSLKFSRSYWTGTLIGHTVQKISKARTAPAEDANLALLANLATFYILFDFGKKECFVLRKYEQRSAPRAHLQHLLHGKGAVKNENDVDSGVCDRLNSLEADVWYVTNIY